MTYELRAAIRYVHENIIGCDSYDRKDWEQLELVKVAAESWARLEWRKGSEFPEVREVREGRFEVYLPFLNKRAIWTFLDGNWFDAVGQTTAPDWWRELGPLPLPKAPTDAH